MITLLTGDCRDVLSTLKEKSVQCIVTSPPYFGLRTYSSDPREIGREATPAAYVAALVAVFAACWRVLRDDGVLFLNLGDSYANNGNRSGEGESRVLSGPKFHGGKAHLMQRRTTGESGLPPKSLLGIPWRVAFALQDAGWILRSDIIWSKPNPMPESVRDRPTRSHEYMFLFAKRQRYYYDADAISEPSISGDTRKPYAPGQVDARGNGHDRKGGSERSSADAGITRNRRSVWSIATQPYAGSHFATMPEALVAPCILAGSAAQACETCGAAWGRVVERGESDYARLGKHNGQEFGRNDSVPGTAKRGQTRNVNGTVPSLHAATTHDRGFAPRCQCATNTGAARSIVLDPFAGSGTVMRVADRFGRDGIGIDLAYQELQEARTNGVQKELFT